MTRQDATIRHLGRVLHGEIDPPALRATASSPLQVAWRSSSGRDYVFVLNLSGTTLDIQAMDVQGADSATSAAVYGEHRSVPISGGTISDTFRPYAVHIYEVPAH